MKAASRGGFEEPRRVPRGVAASGIVLAALALPLVAPPPAAARDESLRITLHFSPQESTHAATPDLPAQFLSAPLDVIFEDGRPAADKDVVGEVLDDDKSSPIHAANDVADFAKKILLDNAAAWGIKVAPGAERSLKVKLVRFFVSQSSKAVGAMFGSEARALVSYTERRRVLWEGSATGSTHRYGKRNEENLNEVLSDALKEAYAFSDPGLQAALSGQRPAAAAASTAAPAEGISPSQLLTELLDLQKQGFGTDVLVRYVNQKTLSAEMTAKDLGQWKKAGMPQEVIKAALARSPGAARP